MQTEDNIDYISIIQNYLRLVKNHWHWVVISPIICCLIAGFYLLITPKVYERTAKIVVKEDSKKSAGDLDEMTILKELNFFSPSTNIKNEMEVLRSHKVMQEVVKRLNLEMSYKKRYGLQRLELYNESPITVFFLDTMKKNNEFSLSVKFLPENKVKIKNFKTKSNTLSGLPITANFFDTINTPLGKITVEPTSFFSENFINKTVHVTKSNTRVIIDFFKNKLNVSTDESSTVIRISITDNSVLRAEDVLNTLITIYDKDRIAFKNLVVKNTSNFINERLEIIKQELSEEDKNISHYKSSNMIADMRTSTDISLRESSKYNKEIFDLQSQLSIAGFIKDYLTNSANKDNLIPSNSGVENTALEKQISDYNLLMLKKFRLLENSSEKSPAVVEMSNLLTEMKQSIIRSVDNLISALKLQISGMKDKELETNQKIADIPEKEVGMSAIERRLKIQENLYIYLLQKREENELGGALPITNYKIIDNAEGSLVPIAPRKRKILFMAFTIGVLIPLGFLYFKEIFNTTIKYSKNVTNNVSIPFLGTIPYTNGENNLLKIRKKESEKKKYIVIKSNNQDAVNEAFRIVRTNLSILTAKENSVKTIMFTSFNECAGKSFVALNLALSFASAKKKTVLIDLDLRKATLSSLIKTSKSGISDYLDNEISSVEQLIVKEPFQPNLDFISSGNLPYSPVETLINDNKLEELIAHLRKTYDYILLDTTAFDAFADASIIEKISDMTLFIVREKMSDERKLSDLEDIYKNNKFSNMSVVLNGGG
jgi:capsular exopolysaccharide synthesis family protein